ncbi:hypothetical protein MASR1M45_12380 [Candidatus Kapaibacterium sp.]
MILRDYQENLALQGFQIISILKIVYLAIEMRVGKTLIALKIAEFCNAKSVLFVTKKKAISSIESDYTKAGFGYNITITNYEQLGKVKDGFDVVIVDEAHGLGKFPRPSLRAIELKRIVSIKKSLVILCSGTPSPETYSQLFHQFWISPYHPFKFESFYKFAHEFVNIKERIFNGLRVRDYKDADNEKIMSVLNKYFIRYSQNDAGFKQNEVRERIVRIPRSPNIDRMVRILLKDRYYRFNDGQEIKADSAAKLQSKIHQAYSGTIRTEQNDFKVIDISKAKYILEQYRGKKIAVFYKFIGEGNVLKKTIPNWTDDPMVFNQHPDKVFICQILSGSMGVNLATADVLIFYNIDFSATQYWQARARIQTFDRESPPLVDWLFVEEGIESKVYEAVLKKKDYTLSYFRKDYEVEV